MFPLLTILFLAHPVGATAFLATLLMGLGAAVLITPKFLFPSQARGEHAKVVDLGGRDFNIMKVFIGVYVTNGISIPPSLFVLREVDTILPICTSAGYIVAWDDTNQKLKVFWANAAAGLATFTEVTNGTDLSAVLVYLLGIGIR